MQPVAKLKNHPYFSWFAGEWKSLAQGAAIQKWAQEKMQATCRRFGPRIGLEQRPTTRSAPPAVPAAPWWEESYGVPVWKGEQKSARSRSSLAGSETLGA